MSTYISAHTPEDAEIGVKVISISGDQVAAQFRVFGSYDMTLHLTLNQLEAVTKGLTAAYYKAMTDYIVARSEAGS